MTRNSWLSENLWPNLQLDIHANQKGIRGSTKRTTSVDPQITQACGYYS